MRKFVNLALYFGVCLSNLAEARSQEVFNHCSYARNPIFSPNFEWCLDYGGSNSRISLSHKSGRSLISPNTKPFAHSSAIFRNDDSLWIASRTGYHADTSWDLISNTLSSIEEPWIDSGQFISNDIYAYLHSNLSSSTLHLYYLGDGLDQIKYSTYEISDPFYKIIFDDAYLYAVRRIIDKTWVTKLDKNNGSVHSSYWLPQGDLFESGSIDSTRQLPFLLVTDGSSKNIYSLATGEVVGRIPRWTCNTKSFIENIGTACLSTGGSSSNIYLFDPHGNLISEIDGLAKSDSIDLLRDGESVFVSAVSTSTNKTYSEYHAIWNFTSRKVVHSWAGMYSPIFHTVSDSFVLFPDGIIYDVMRKTKIDIKSDVDLRYLSLDRAILSQDNKKLLTKWGDTYVETIL